MKYQKDNDIDNTSNTDDIDKLLYEHYKNKKIPKELDNLIQDFPNNYRRKFKPVIHKIAAIIIICFIATTGIVFAKDISNFLKEIFNLNSININNDEVINSIENKDYIQNVEMDYIKLNEIYNIKVDYLMIDDINLYIVFNVQSNEKINKSYRISINDLVLLDDFDNVIYDANNQSVENNYLATAGWKSIEEYNAYQKRELFFLMSNGIPKLTKLKIKFTKLALYNSLNPGNDSIEISGNYSFNIDIIDKFIDRKTYKFIPDSSTINSQQDYIIDKCIVTETGTYLIYKTLNSSIELNIIEANQIIEKTLLGIGYDNYYYFINQYSSTPNLINKCKELIVKDQNGIETLLKK